MKKYEKTSKDKKKIEIEDSNGLKISYDRDEISDQFPHLLEEISTKKKSLKIESINMNVEQENEIEPQNSNNLYPNELHHPSVLDFLRRCSENEEAIDILEYLMERKEITLEDYIKYKKIISQEGGLKQLIDENGGLKRPGYYMRKYYKKNTNNQEINTK
ncbi:MAG: DUF2095 family protein [Candidatus Thorarchaeota archaeon]